MSRRRVIPGFGLSLGITITWLSIIVLIPLLALFLKAASADEATWKQIVSSPRVLAAFKLSFGASFCAALASTVFGLVVAWVLVRYEFPGRRLLDASIDLPFAIPTAVAGITLTHLYYREGWIGRWLDMIGVQGAYSQFGVFIALTFVGFPFVVRTVQPVIEDLGREVEEAAATLGAGRATTFVKVVLPLFLPALLTGFTLAFARSLGEYGSVIFISGNLPGKTEIVPLLIVSQLEQFKYAGAAVIAALMLSISFVLLFAVNLLHRKLHRPSI